MGGRHWRLAYWCLLAGVLGTAGCGPEPSLRAPEETRAATPLAWPAPPDQARIRFLRAVAGPADLGIRPSFLERLGELVMGRRETWMIRPTGVAVADGVLYVADPGAQALWILDGSGGRFLEIHEAAGERLISPVAVTLGRRGRIYLADSYLRRVFTFDPHGVSLGALKASSFLRPAGLAYDEAADRLYVADSAGHRIWVLSGDGATRGAIGERGTEPGKFNYPTHVAVDRAGTLYVTDSLGFRVQMFARDGGFLGAFGRHGDASGYLAAPKGLGVDSEGHIYVVDALFDAVQIFDRTGQFLLAFGQRGVAPGRFWLPGGLFIDAEDRIYVADSYNQRLQIFQYLPEAGGG